MKHLVRAVPTDQLRQVLRHLPEPLRVVHLHLLRPPDGHGLEVLRPHHRPHAGPAVDMLELVHHAGEAHKVLPARPDQRHPRPLFANLFLDRVLRRARLQPPDLFRRPDLGLAVVDPQVRRLLRPSRDDHGVKTGKLQFRTPEPAGLRLPVRPRQGRLGRYREAGHSGDRCPGNHSGGKNQDVLRRQRIDPRPELPQQVVGSQSPASKIGAVNDLPGLLRLHLTGGQIHPQYLAVIPVWHAQPPLLLTTVSPTGH